MYIYILKYKTFIYEKMVKYIYVLIIKYIISTIDNVCLDNNGKKIDWYFIYLLPKNKTYNNKLFYLYFDEKISKIKKYTYNNEKFPPNKIIEYLKTENDEINYFIWNDDASTNDGNIKKANKKKAHSKGILIYNSVNGLFLMHSVPKFPKRNYFNEILDGLPDNVGKFAQTFLCISLDKNNAEKLVKIINCINVFVIDSTKGDNVNLFGNIYVYSLIYNIMDIYCPDKEILNITSLNGKNFVVISKNYNYKVVPYDTTLREIFYDDFFIRTWTRPNLSPSLKDKYFIKNILEIEIENYKLKKNIDHSKWSISSNKNIICIGDLNHSESQKNRGGNIICFENKNLHDILKKSIVKYD